ncbi:apolipoprotein A1/A4/E domain-containing protein [Hyphomicrobium sp. CS1GBMeth3]|uniref:apolipoprotein A1/A4/E domain-containing protein n=1 Tax=Hyphomicrobium sp. CS1GBMeth3 TaxID=1892845 RepID=UPI000AB2176C|nr:apolipoprotein A1/A4/E domain-containing protein [Hyphomicrobium sp. CS1GBMeth3]
MAQEQKTGSAAAPKGPPDGAAQAASVKTSPALPPPLPAGAASGSGDASKSNAPTKGSGDSSLADSLALVLPASSVVNLGSATASGNHKLPPPLPNMAARAQAAPPVASERPAEPPVEPVRRMARRRPAGPPRQKIAANDDAPSIGGLIYALEQKPSTTPFKYAAMASAGWVAICLVFGWIIVSAELEAGATLATLLAKPSTFLTVTAIIVPIAVLWALALLAWRSDELRLRSSTMTEVAIRLAEPDRMAEQSVASLGQAVRRQVSFMNDAISRALGRAGELEALVHNEVTALERSYEENERKIKSLIQELAGERTSLLSTSERVTETLKTLGTDIPTLIDRLSNQQIKLAGIIQGAGDNLAQLETAVGQSTDRLESALGGKTHQLQVMLEGYTSGLATALGARTDQLQAAIASYVDTLDTSLSQRTEKLQSVFEEYARALDTSLSNKAQALDIQLVERTKALDAAFGERLRSFDESIVRSTMTIDSAVAEKARALTSALDSHARSFSETIARQAVNLDESVMHGINSVRRTSENITRQSLKAIEGLAGQSDMLKRVSENLLGQVNAVTNRFEGQGQAIMRAANSLENANYKIEATLQGRHAELTQTMEQLTGKADEFGRFVQGFSSTMEGSLTSAEQRARAAAEELRVSTEAAQRAALADLERFRLEAGAEGERALDELKNRFSSISNVVTEQLSSLTSRFDETSDEVRQRASRAAADIAAEQARLKREMDQLPTATRENAEAMRRALHDQLRAIEQLSNLTTRSISGRDVSLPQPSPSPYGGSAQSSLTGSYVAEARGAPRQPTSPYQQALPRPGGAGGGPPDGREGWSLGDLLARASRDDEAHGAGTHPPPQLPVAPVPFQNQIDLIARALDPATTAALWQRIAAGQRGVMVRSIYTPEGRAIFDDLSIRYRSDADLQRTINHYLIDFENIRRDAEQRDPSGRAVNAHLLSDMGRVYLFLAHLSGRIS